MFAYLEYVAFRDLDMLRARGGWSPGSQSMQLALFSQVPKVPSWRQGVGNQALRKNLETNEGRSGNSMFHNW